MSTDNRKQKIPLQVRYAIIALRQVGGMSYPDISLALQVHPETARQIVVRAKERAASDSVLEMLEMVEDRKPGLSTPRPKTYKSSCGIAEDG
jgi:transposase-like protein